MNRALSALAVIGLLLVAPATAWAQGAVVGHFTECGAAGGIFLVGDDGSIVTVDYTHNDGDFRRDDVDGTAWVHTSGGNAAFTVFPVVGPPLFGTGSFAVSTTAVTFDPFPCGAWFIDGVQTTIHLTAQMVDASGAELQLLVQAVLRDNETLLLRISLQ